jgi:ABC-type sugar transport system ATPase subunit
VVVFSTDLEELAALADRTLYMSGGRLSTEFLGGAA